MAETKLFDQKMYDSIKQDFKRGGKHEKIFKCIMLAIFCVAVILLIFCYRYYAAPTTLQVVGAYYVKADESVYKVKSYYIDVVVQGRTQDVNYDEFVTNAANEYKDQFQDAFIMVTRFYYQENIDNATSKPEGKPLEEIVYYITEERSNEDISYEVQPNVKSNQYDYECYLREIVIPTDDECGAISIHPIHFIDLGDPEEVAKYGLDLTETVGTYEILDDNDEVISLPLNEDTVFLVINWNHDQELADNSINHALNGWCLVKDAEYFWNHMQSEYGEWMYSYPMFITVDELGYVDQVVELWLP